ncbi:MAG: hypothetical protein GY715_12815 [Planctomycetes bacterium]|nr:hypothetical protein [Planctomycetota bacterium]
MRMTPRHRFALLAGLLTVLLLLPVAPAAGQGTDGAFADPVSTHELMKYADRMELSGQQRAALESIHDRYKDDFRALRDGEIARFLKETRSMQSAGMMPERKALQEMFDGMEKLQTKIRSLDDRLFDQLQPMLTDDQSSMLPRVRLQRERHRYEGQQMMWFMGRPPTDISTILPDLDLEGEVFEVVDATMSSYERRLTSEVRKLSKSSQRMFLDVFDRLEALGYSDMTNEEMMENPERMQEMMKAMEGIWQDVTAKAQGIAAGITTLNDNTYSSIAAVLPTDDRRAFRNEYYTKSYPELAGIMMSIKQPWIERVLSIKDLTDEERQGLEGVLDEHHRKLDRMIDEGVKLVREHRENRSPFTMAEGWQEFSEEIQKINLEASQLLALSMANVRDIVGAERFARLQQSTIEEAKAAVAAAGGMPVEAVDADAAEIAEQEAMVPEYTDHLVPKRITRTDLRWYARRLGLDEGGRAVLDELYLGYLEKMKDLKALERTRNAAQTMWKYDAETGVSTPPEASDIERVYQLRREAFEAIAALDDAFFADVALAVATEEQAPIIERLRGDRARSRYSVDQQPWGWGNQSAEGNVDLVRFLSRQKLSDDELAAVDGALRNYEAAAAQAFADRFEAAIAMQKTQELMSAEMTRAQAENETSAMEYGMRYQATIQPLTKRLSETKTVVIELNQKTLAEVLEVLSANADGASNTGRSIRLEYNRLAFPQIYKDPVSVERHLATSLTFEDLTAEQRQLLNELAAAYRPEYETFCREMVEISGGPSFDPFSMESADWSEYQARESKMQKLRFDRNELNYRAIGRLREVLTEPQVTRIGGLPEMKEERSVTYW